MTTTTAGSRTRRYKSRCSYGGTISNIRTRKRKENRPGKFCFDVFSIRIDLFCTRSGFWKNPNTLFVYYAFFCVLPFECRRWHSIDNAENTLIASLYTFDFTSPLYAENFLTISSLLRKRRKKQIPLKPVKRYKTKNRFLHRRTKNEIIKR